MWIMHQFGFSYVVQDSCVGQATITSELPGNMIETTLGTAIPDLHSHYLFQPDVCIRKMVPPQPMGYRQQLRGSNPFNSLQNGYMYTIHEWRNSL